MCFNPLEILKFRMDLEFRMDSEDLNTDFIFSTTMINMIF